MLPLLALYALTLALLTRHLPDAQRSRARWLPTLLILAAATQAPTPLTRLALVTLGLLYSLKAAVLLNHSKQQVQNMHPQGLALYFTLWPGMDPAPLTRKDPETPFPARPFIQGWATMVASATAMIALHTHGIHNSWLALAGLLGFIHFGWSDVLFALVRALRFPVPRLFNDPLAAKSPRDFWSKRWNVPFADMNRLLFLPLFTKRLSKPKAVTAAFLLSGLLHELAISFPPQAGWKRPFAYFALQAVAMQQKLGRAATWLLLLAPLPLLFPEPFREQCIQPIWSILPVANLPTLLKLAGYGHFLVLCASFQVPTRLGWPTELQRLRPLNRKLLWVYGGFIAAMIAAWGVTLLKLGPAMLAGDPSARWILGLITVWWAARIIVDALVFEHSDWPQGPEFIVGHTLLTSLFLYLVATCCLVLASA